MPRLTALAPESTQGRARDLLDAVRAKLGVVPNLMRTLAHAPAALGGYLALSGALAEGQLAPSLRSRLALAVARRNDCDYCLAAHAALGKAGGLSERDVAEAAAGRAPSPKDAAALAFAAAVLGARGDVSDADLAQARAAGLGDGELVEIVAHVSLNVLTNYVNRLARTEVDFPPFEGGAR
jgi:uncharacterized peroxidase-related enzyme